MTISKTSFLLFLQCPKLFWHSINNPQESETNHLLRQGKEVESLARQLFPKGVFIEHGNFNEAVDLSKEAITRADTPVFNSLLCADKLLAEVDVLFPVDDEYDIYEIKSSTEIKEEHIIDISFQKHVANKMGLRIRNCFIVTINNKYIRHGEINPQQMFRIQDVTDGIIDVTENIESALEILHQKCPDTKIGLQCADDCLWRDTCWQIDEYNIFNLYRIQKKRAWGWYEKGIIKTSDIPNDYPLTSNQKIQVEAEKSGQIYQNIREIKRFCNQLQFPLYFLDFETINPAIPFDNCRPYEQIPFQYSLHVMTDLNEIEHYGWIWDGVDDSQKILLEHLKERLQDTGSIIVYNAVFEKSVLKNAVERYPEYKEWLKNIEERIIDLLIPFRKFHMYHPKQKGSCSIKDVLPALTNLTYEGMEISDGIMAGIEFMDVLNNQDEDKEITLKHLEEYCGLDTLAMIEIMRVMKLLNNP